MEAMLLAWSLASPSTCMVAMAVHQQRDEVQPLELKTCLKPSEKVLSRARSL